jgi:hypothetical protein
MHTATSSLILRHVAVSWLLVLSSSACDGSSPSLPTRPPPASPAPMPPAVPTVTLSGTVVERVSGQPLEGMVVEVWPRTFPTDRRAGWFRRSSGRSDASGHYRIPGIEADFGSFWVSTWSGDRKYVQPCATTVTLNADANQDVTVTSRDNLAIANSLPLPAVPGTRTISGVVFEVTEAGRQPVAEVMVGFEGFMDFVSAWTFTDASGRYVLCGLPETSLMLFSAIKSSSPYPNQLSYTTVEAGSDTTLDIELARR